MSQLSLTSLLNAEGINPSETLVFRHRPAEAKIRAIFPWLAAERPDLFNDFQRTHGRNVEASLARTRFLASFVGHGPGKALFVGLYERIAMRAISGIDTVAEPGFAELVQLGMNPDVLNHEGLMFELTLTKHLANWKGRLVVDWPPLDRAWSRWAARNTFPVHAITEDSCLVPSMPSWESLSLDWAQLQTLPMRWQDRLSQWRGVYLIFDADDGKSYVGSAYGSDNLLGRWRGYAASGHGGNRDLKGRDPANFHFSILQLAAPNLPAEDVIAIENSWKTRLHTRAPWGLNAN